MIFVIHLHELYHLHICVNELYCILSLNPFLANIPILYLLKYLSVLGGYKKGALARKGISLSYN